MENIDHCQLEIENAYKMEETEKMKSRPSKKSPPFFIRMGIVLLSLIFMQWSLGPIHFVLEEHHFCQVHKEFEHSTYHKHHIQPAELKKHFSKFEYPESAAFSKVAIDTELQHHQCQFLAQQNQQSAPLNYGSVFSLLEKNPIWINLAQYFKISSIAILALAPKLSPPKIG